MEQVLLHCVIEARVVFFLLFATVGVSAIFTSILFHDKFAVYADWGSVANFPESFVTSFIFLTTGQRVHAAPMCILY